MDLIDELKARIESIKPRIVLGDEDSIDLTPHQAGRKEGLSEALTLVEELKEEIAESMAATARSWGHRFASLLGKLGLDFGDGDGTQWAILRDAHRTIRWDAAALQAANENKDWPPLPRLSAKIGPSQPDARKHLLSLLEDELTAYLLDHCPEGVNWENFDPDVDSLRSQVQEASGQ